MLEFFVTAVGEFLLQIVVETLIELGFHSLAEPFRRPPNPLLAAVGFAVFGVIVGGVSLAVFPAHLTPEGLPRIGNLILTPVLVGLSMVWMGNWRERRGDAVLRIDRFSYGYLFALALALTRFLFAR